MSPPKAELTDNAVIAQAAEWLVRLQHDPAPATREACERWRAAHPQHEQVWQRMSAMEHDLRSGTRKHPLAATTLGQARDALRRDRRARLKWLLCLGLTVGVGWQGRSALESLPPWQALRADLRTRAGERRDITLEDGTRLALNSRTAVNIRFDATQRHILLLEGEVMVTTAADVAGRPLTIGTEHGHVTPVGTRFTVRRLETAGRPIRVGVLEGAVDIHPQGDAFTHRVAASRQRDFGAGQLFAEHPLSEDASAWTRGMLIANRMPLEEFIAELARHRSGTLRSHPNLRGLQLSGAFPLDDSDRVLEMLEQVLPVRVQYLTRYWVTVSHR